MLSIGINEEALEKMSYIISLNKKPFISLILHSTYLLRQVVWKEKCYNNIVRHQNAKTDHYKKSCNKRAHTSIWKWFQFFSLLLNWEYMHFIWQVHRRCVHMSMRAILKWLLRHQLVERKINFSLQSLLPQQFQWSSKLMRAIFLDVAKLKYY